MPADGTADVHATIAEEDRARAGCYALVSRLFYAPPDGALLSALAGDDQGEPPAPTSAPSSPAEGRAPDYPSAYQRLVAAYQGSDLEALRQEYDTLFVGAGKSPVSLYTSGYAAPNSADRHLVTLREHLVEWGLGRRQSVFEVEDHVSAVCDVMRWLIENDRPLADQRAFFGAFVHPGLNGFCDAVEASPGARFYRAAAGLARAFAEIEREAFEMHLEE